MAQVGIIMGSNSDLPIMQEAIDILKRKKRGKYTILQTKKNYQPDNVEYRELYGMAFSQDRNNKVVDASVFTKENCKTNNKNATDLDKLNLLLATTTLKYTQSNSICFAYDGQAIGIGAGQQNRVDCVALCGQKSDTWFLRQMPEVLNLYNLFKQGTSRQAKVNAILSYVQNEMNHKQYYEWKELFTTEPTPLNQTKVNNWLSKIKGIAMSSDAFFPFPDSIELGQKHGVSTVIQPGGSIRDDSIIRACNNYNMTMFMSSVRVFTH